MGRIEEIDVATGKTLQVVAAAGPVVRTLVANPDGRSVAGIEGDHKLFLLERTQDAADWQQRTSAAQPDVLAKAVPAFSPQSNRLVLGGRDGRTLLVWNLRRPNAVDKVDLPVTSMLIGHLFLDEETLLSWTEGGDLHRWRLSDRLKR